MSMPHLPDLDSGVTVTSTEELGQLLRAVRKASKLKQSTIAGLANWGGRFIGDVENGKPTVRAQMLFDLVGWLGLEIVVRKKGTAAAKTQAHAPERAP
jgi:HTH-type transcriptional regulator/antitoxin HipB